MQTPNVFKYIVQPYHELWWRKIKLYIISVAIYA